MVMAESERSGLDNMKGSARSPVWYNQKSDLRGVLSFLQCNRQSQISLTRTGGMLSRSEAQYLLHRSPYGLNGSPMA